MLSSKFQTLFYHLQINLKSISHKSYKPLKDLLQKYKPLKEIIGSVHFPINQTTYTSYDVCVYIYTLIFSTQKKKEKGGFKHIHVIMNAYEYVKKISHFPY